MQISKIYEIQCTDLSIEGAGIGRIDGMVVFVPGLLPGEEATIQVTKIQKTYAMGELIEINKASAARVEPECPYFSQCGGCSLMHLSYEDQFLWKQKHVADCLKKFAGIEIAPRVHIAAEKPLQYRNKATFFIKNKQIGYYAEKSHTLVPIEQCGLLVSPINIVLKRMQNWLNTTNVQTAALHKMIVRANTKGTLLVGLVLDKNDAALLEEILTLLQLEPLQIKGVLYRVEKHRRKQSPFRLLWGVDIVQEDFLGLSFSVSIDSFLQVNHPVAERLYQTAFDLGNFSKADTIFDLYSGVGTLTLLAAQHVKQAYGVEVVQSAVKNAKQNVVGNKLDNAVFLLADAAEAFALVSDKIDAVMVDPPRRGLAPTLIDDIAKRDIAKVVYISCNPATLARDVKLFVAKGYAAEALAIADMFPQTTHVESIVVMSKL